MPSFHTRSVLLCRDSALSQDVVLVDHLQFELLVSLPEDLPLEALLKMMYQHYNYKHFYVPPQEQQKPRQDNFVRHQQLCHNNGSVSDNAKRMLQLVDYKNHVDDSLQRLSKQPRWRSVPQLSDLLTQSSEPMDFWALDDEDRETRLAQQPNCHFIKQCHQLQILAQQQPEPKKPSKRQFAGSPQPQEEVVQLHKRQNYRLVLDNHQVLLFFLRRFRYPVRIYEGSQQSQEYRVHVVQYDQTEKHYTVFKGEPLRYLRLQLERLRLPRLLGGDVMTADGLLQPVDPEEATKKNDEETYSLRWLFRQAYGRENALQCGQCHCWLALQQALSEGFTMRRVTLSQVTQQTVNNSLNMQSILVTRPPKPPKTKSERELRVAQEKEDKKNRLTGGQKRLSLWFPVGVREDEPATKRQKVNQ
jgi:hypothetical protein